MSDFLSDDWFAELAAAGAVLPEVGGADAIVQFVVSGSPGGKVQFSVEVASGRIVSLTPGKHADASVTITWKYADAAAIFRGELDPDAAFMSGATKVEGDYPQYLQRLRCVFGPAGMATLRDGSSDTSDRSG